jgi:3-phenylpropionate/cinnamic acid dioxygenase small subunit
MAEREPTAEERITVTGAVMLTNLPVGAKVRLRGEAVGEVTANPRDGGWVFVRYLESPKDPAKVGTVESVFCADVLADFMPESVTRDSSPSTQLPITGTSETTQQLLERLLLEREIERFLYHEADLLDERRFNEWIELIADDIHYHMPIRRNVKFGEQYRENTDSEFEISWFDEGKATLAGRVRQIMTGLHWCEEPFSRVRHIVSNVQLLDVEGDEVNVRSRFFVYTNRLHDEVNLFVGKRDDVLRRDPDTGWKIAKRTIILDQNVLLAKVITTFF